MCGRIPWVRNARRYLSWSYPRSAYRSSGRRRGRPRRPRTVGNASTSGSSSVTSLRFPPVNEIASGTPFASVRTWCFEPARPRSTGLGPLLGRAEQPARAKSRSPPSTDPACPRGAAHRAGCGAGVARRRPCSIPPGAASRSCRTRTPTLAAGTPIGSRCAVRTRSHTTPDDRRAGVGQDYPPCAAYGAAAGPPAPTTRPTRSTAVALLVAR